jgi:gluconokinase
MQKQFPRSAYDKVNGIVYFARMLDKIRLKAEGKLPEEYFKNLEIGFNGRCCRFLGITYADVRERVEQGGTDEEILQWCFDHGRRPNDEEILIWNAFMTKRGWRDDNTEHLNRQKAESGLSDRSEIQTLFDYYEFDEGRSK